MENLKNIPDSLKNTPQWLLWLKSKETDPVTGKFKKFPRGINFKFGMGNFPLVTFDEAYNHLLKNPYKYTGLGFHCINGVVGIDIDNCFEEGGWYNEMAKDIVDTLDTYTEKSPSGTGLRLFIRSNNPPSVKTYENDIGLEIFSNSNFFTTVTGDVENDVDVQERTKELDLVIEKYLSHKKEQSKGTSSREYKKEGKIIEGQGRDNNLTSVVGKFIQTGTKDYDELMSMATSHTQQRHSPPLEYKEIERIVKSILKKHLKKFPEDAEENLQDERLPLEFNKEFCTYVKSTETYKPKNIQENVETLLNYFSIRPKYNELIKGLDISVPDRCFTKDNKEELELQFVYNLCLKNGFMNISKELIKAILLDIGDKDKYHPVRDYLDSVFLNHERDICKNGITELLKLENTLDTGLFDYDIKHMLIKKWLLSCVEAIYSEKGIASQGVLTLQGAQGDGKTTWFKRLCAFDNEWFKEGLTLNPDNKDSVSIAVSYWICELGEIESTFKKDMDSLKAFITTTTDVLRRPYARGVSHYPRRTIFCGTVNGFEYLKDDTGNRRFWTIPVVSLDLEAEINFDLLWSEIIHLRKMGESYWLTKDEIKILAESNKQFEAKDYVDTLIDSVFCWGTQERYWLKSSDIFEILDKAKELSSTKIGKALKKRGVESKSLDGCTRYAMPKAKSDIYGSLYTNKNRKTS